MRRGKRNVVGRVPVLGHHHVGKILGHAVDDRDDLIAVFHRKAAAGKEAVLHVDDDQHAPIVDRDFLRRARHSRRSEKDDAEADAAHAADDLASTTVYHGYPRNLDTAGIAAMPHRPDLLPRSGSAQATYLSALPGSASHTRRGTAGMSTPRASPFAFSASTTALITAGGAPTAPASPAPLMPSGFAVHGTLWVENEKNGKLSARGMA